MNFTLVYKGELKSNRGKKDKHILRRHFHSQLKKYWGQYPLKDYEKAWNRQVRDFHENLYIVSEVGKYKFVPLVNDKFYLTAAISIDMLMPDPPGSTRLQAGDIDNRLKTLLDALRMPRVESEIPDDFVPNEDEQLFFCLLEDDSLLTNISVNTHRWLEPNIKSSDVLLTINVKTSITRLMAYNSELGANIV